jgi:hypothetical protein
LDELNAETILINFIIFKNNKIVNYEKIKIKYVLKTPVLKRIRSDIVDKFIGFGKKLTFSSKTKINDIP